MTTNDALRDVANAIDHSVFIVTHDQWLSAKKMEQLPDTQPATSWETDYGAAAEVAPYVTGFLEAPTAITKRGRAIAAVRTEFSSRNVMLANILLTVEHCDLYIRDILLCTIEGKAPFWILRSATTVKEI